MAWLRKQVEEADTNLLRGMLKRWDIELLRMIRNLRLSGPLKFLHQGSKRWNLARKIEDPKALQVFYTDFTGIKCGGENKKACPMPIIDQDEIGCWWESSGA